MFTVQLRGINPPLLLELFCKYGTYAGKWLWQAHGEPGRSWPDLGAHTAPAASDHHRLGPLLAPLRMGRGNLAAPGEAYHASRNGTAFLTRTTPRQSRLISSCWKSIKPMSALSGRMPRLRSKFPASASSFRG